MLEALAVGAPVLCSGRYSGLFGDSVLCVDATDATMISQKLLRDPLRVEGIAERGRQFVRKNFSAARFNMFISEQLDATSIWRVEGMAKLEAKVLLAIGAASILFSLVGGVFLFAMMGELHWSQLLAVAAIAILIDGATILVWVLFPARRQIRRERVHVTKLVLRELGILGADVREGVDSLRNALESVQHQEVDQGERQRKILNTLRSESRSHRARIEKIAATQNRSSV